MRYLFGIVAVLLGFFIGVALPDLDFRASFLTHRSMVTHGAIIPVVLFLLAYRTGLSVIRLFVVGVCVAVAIYSIFCMFPERWEGTAQLHLPGVGYVSPGLAVVWLTLSVVVCLYLMLSLNHTGFEVGVTLVSLVVGFAYLSVGERVFWYALMVLVVALGVVLLIPMPPRAFLQHVRHGDHL